jgi:hypothetical protein
MKNCAANAAHGNAVLAVGLRAETLLQRFLLATTASKVFHSPQILFRSSAPALRSFSEVGSSVTSVFKIRIRAIRGKNLTGRCFGHERTQSTQRVFLYDLCDPLWLKNSDPKILAPISEN